MRAQLRHTARVNHRSPFVRLFALVCFAALMSTHVFGVARGYQCDCTGRVEWTAQDHCHGPHDADCHGDEASGQVPDHSDDTGERRDHEQVREDMRLRLVQSLEAPALVPVLIAVWGEKTVWSAEVLPLPPTAEADVG